MASESDPKTYQQIELLDEFCVRGNETKNRIVSEFTIKPFSHLKLISSQNVVFLLVIRSFLYAGFKLF